MLQPKSVALKFLAFFVAAKQGKTGLSVTVDVYDENDAALVTGVSATEIAGGWYKYVLVAGSNDAYGEYKATFKTSDATVDAQHIPSLWVVAAWIDAITAKTNLLGVTVPVIQTPYNPNSGKITLIRGDDYLVGVLPAFTSAAWPDLTGASEVRLTIRRRPTTSLPTDIDSSVLTMTDTTSARVVGAGTQSVLFEPKVNGGGANNQVGGTKDLPTGPNSAKWDIQATLANGALRTLAYGLMTVIEDQTRS